MAVEAKAVGTRGTFTIGKETAFLCMPVPGAHPHVDAKAGRATATFAGSVDEFVAAHEAAAGGGGGDAGLRGRMKNRVRRCACGKSVAYTLPACNLCGASLAGASITLVDNVFTGFIHGIARCAQFPLTISLRAETPAYLVFDDLLALSLCHLNVVPTTQYIPDWRYLLRRPRAALQLVREMHAMCAAVLREQFLANASWRTRMLRDGGGGLSDDQLVAAVAAGFNMPPSQYQLHLQFIMPPLLPYQHLMLLLGNHFTYGRFFPLEYVVAVLERLGDTPLEGGVSDDTPIEDIVARIRKTYGIDYDECHKLCCERIARDHDRLANWRAEDFAAYGVGEKVFSIADGSELPNVTAKSVAAADKLALQSYGRPYTAEGKPSGTFYSFAKQPADIDIW